MKTLSLLLPTRERPDAVLRLFDSLVRTTAHLENVEVVLYVDADDTGSLDLDTDTVDVVKLIRPRSTMGVMTRECYEASCGRYIMLLNDDVVFATRGWDTAVVKAFSAFPDDIALIWGNDLFRGDVFPSHPFLSRRFCDLTTGPCPTAYIHDYIDTHIYDIFRALKERGHDRLVYLPEVVFEHHCSDAGKSTHPDAISKLHSAADLQTYLLWAEDRALRATHLAETIRDSAEAPRKTVSQPASARPSRC